MRSPAASRPWAAMLKLLFMGITCVSLEDVYLAKKLIIKVVTD
jgi:hypothetical protein